jgi:hypothetical protein
MLICNVWDWFDCECSLEKSRLWREPDGGNLHVRFDEGEESGGHWSLCLSFRAFLSTLLVSNCIVRAKGWTPNGFNFDEWGLMA